MNLTTGFLLTLTGHMLRLGSGMLVFIMLARLLGAQQFGQFSYALALATLASIPVNAGLGTLILHRFGQAPDTAQETMNTALTLRLLLGAMVLLVSLLGFPLVLKTPLLAVFMALLIAQIADSFNELYTLGFRAHGHFREETITASLVSAWHIVVMLSIVSWHASVLSAALAFAISRISGLCLTRYRCQQFFGRVQLSSFSAAWGMLRRAWAYALELGFFTLYGQLDSVLINSFLGPTALGLYQAGMKLNQGASRLAPVLAQTLLPELSRRAHAKQAGLGRYIGRTLIIFSALGALGGGFLMLFPQAIVQHLFGPAYQPLISLLPLFGGMMIVQFLETGCGLVLVALGLQAQKVWFVAIQLMLLLIVGSYFLVHQGLVGWQWTYIGSLGLLIMAYLGLYLRSRSADYIKTKRPQNA